MAPTQDNTGDHLTPSLLRAILLILVDSREEPESMTKPEILLTRAGLNVKDISALLDKKEDSVRKVITRAH